MSAHSPINSIGNLGDTTIYRIGALAAFLVLIGYIATFPVYAWVGNPPKTGVDAQLAYFGTHSVGWWIITGLMVGTDLLLIPLFLALYHALKKVGNYMMLIALAMKFLFISLDLSVTWTAFSELIVAGGKFAVATDAVKTTLIAGASYASVTLESPISGVYAIIIPATGVLLVGLVMLRSGFSRATAYLGVLTGLTGIAFILAYFFEAFRVLQYVNAIFATIWYGFVFFDILKLSRRR